MSPPQAWLSAQHPRTGQHAASSPKKFLYFLLFLFLTVGFLYRDWVVNQAGLQSVKKNNQEGPQSIKKNNQEWPQSTKKNNQEGPQSIKKKNSKHSLKIQKDFSRPASPACPIPELVPYHKSITHLLLKSNIPVSSLGRCEMKYPVLFKSNRDDKPAIFPVKKEKDFRREGYDQCCYRTVERTRNVRNPEGMSWDREPTILSPKCFPLSLNTKTEIPKEHEFIAIYCKGKATKGKRKMVDVHAFVPLKPKKASSTKPTKEKGKGKLNLVIFGLDSVSRMSMLRSMPKTYRFLKEKMGAVEMTGYNKIAENTFPNLLPMLTSKTPQEVSWTKEGNLDHLPFIWKQYSEQGYYTSFSEDQTESSIFNYHKPGFNKPPTDYYLRPISRWADKHIWFWDKLAACYGPRLTLQFLLNYMEKYVHVMSQNGKNFFQLSWATSLTHDDINSPLLADAPVHNSLKWLKGSGYLNQTIFILMSDHGMRLGKFRNTVQGQLEDLLPFMSIFLPNSFKKKYGRAYQNLVGNRAKLMTVFDIHETLKDILYLKGLQPTSLKRREADLARLGKKLPRGISLFLPIPPFRTCDMARIPQKFCSCTMLKSVNVTNNPKIKAIANVGVFQINSFLPSKCAPLKLEKVTMAQQHMSNGKTSGKQLESYLINFQTKPGGGHFEALISRKNNGSSWKIQGEIDRTDSYRTQSHCVEKGRLKLFCYCGDLTKPNTTLTVLKPNSRI